MYCLKTGRTFKYSPLDDERRRRRRRLQLHSCNPPDKQKMSHNSAVEMLRRLTFGASPAIVFLTIVSALPPLLVSFVCPPSAICHLPHGADPSVHGSTIRLGLIPLVYRYRQHWSPSEHTSGRESMPLSLYRLSSW